MTPGRADIELFVECLFNQYSHILLREEHITRADKLKGYDVSKGTIRFPYNKPLPKELIAEIAVWCYKQYAK
jgi:uncharacterized protein YdhG (YjbR/CyaY superfamily)